MPCVIPAEVAAAPALIANRGSRSGVNETEGRYDGAVRSPLALLAWLLVLVSGGCARTSTTGSPAETVAAYVRAIRNGDAQAAYGLLDRETQAGLPYAEFERMMAENRQELEEQAAELERRLAQPMPAEARIRLDNGDPLLLVREEKGWRIEEGIVEAPVLRSPRDAVLELRRAVRRRSLRDIERVLSREARARLEGEIERFLAETADELDLDTQVEGSRARVRTTEGREILLVKEAGEWRVVAVE